MAEPRAVIRELKRHIQRGALSGSEFADAVVDAFEAIEKRLIEIEGRLPPPRDIKVGGPPSAGTPGPKK